MAVGQVDALAARHGAADDDFSPNRLLVLRADLQLHPSVVDQDLFPGLDVPDHVPVERKIGTGARAQGDDVAILEHPRALEMVEPVPGSHQVDHHPDGPAGLLADLPHEPDEATMLLPGAVGLVQPDDVDAGADQPREGLRIRARGADRGDDLRSTLHGCLSSPGSLSDRGRRHGAGHLADFLDRRARQFRDAPPGPGRDGLGRRDP